MNISPSLIAKYEQPLPRYTSYPTVPFWKTDEFDQREAFRRLESQMLQNSEVSIYIHLPYCESLCTFCGCNRRITKNHSVEEPYINALLEEWRLLQLRMPVHPVITHLHLGGGTPTFFSPRNLERMINHIVGAHKLSETYEFSIEVHPNTCTFQHIDTLADLGFRRISVGIQDFDPKVQYIINRNQTFEKTREIIDYAREKGFTGVNVDLVYGLPLQTLESIRLTLDKVAKIQPQRIAYYAYAHVPWKSKAQRRYSEEDLPSASEKITMFLSARQLLMEQGYNQVGMDHFALPDDGLTLAWSANRLHRNFMGYTTDSTRTLIGLGASSISDFYGAYIQNLKETEAYIHAISQGTLPIERGHILSDRDIAIRKCIMNVMCNRKIYFPKDIFSHDHLEYIIATIESFIQDEALIWDGESLTPTDFGQLILRNIAAIFDSYLFEKGLTENMFSKSV
ncbi:MAG: oxygen-independent coproporphyrinogen III oxidase [Thermaurantimonas sp.]